MIAGMNIPHKKTSKGITIEVKVEPRSSQACLAGVMDNAILKVKLTCPPVEGAANEQLIELIARQLNIKKSQVSVIRGLKSKRKVIQVSGLDAIP